MEPPLLKVNEEAWINTNKQLEDLERVLLDIQDIKDDKEREAALKPFRERCRAIMKRRYALVDEARQNEIFD